VEGIISLTTEAGADQKSQLGHGWSNVKLSYPDILRLIGSYIS